MKMPAQPHQSLIDGLAVLTTLAGVESSIGSLNWPGNASADGPGNLTTAEPQSGIWLRKLDDLCSFGKPSGWGGPWWEQPVKAALPSDPYLMTGFDQKCLHLRHEAGTPVMFRIDLDAMGTGPFETLSEITTERAAVQVFPSGLSAHWVRLVPDRNCIATAQFFYT